MEKHRIPYFYSVLRETCSTKSTRKWSSLRITPYIESNPGCGKQIQHVTHKTRRYEFFTNKFFPKLVKQAFPENIFPDTFFWFDWVSQYLP